MFTLPILSQVVLNGLSLSSIYILVALGFTLLFGIMRVVNFAHGAFAMLGGYALYYLYGVYQLPYPIAILGGAILVAALALILERLVFRWFYHKMFQSMIALLGLNLALVYAAVLVWDVNERSLPSVSDHMVDALGVSIPADRLIIMGIAGVVLALFWLFVTRTRQGLAMRAAAMDPEIAATQGINTRRIYMLAFFIAVFMTALAGGLYAQSYALSPFMGERPLMVAFIVVILGGMGSVPGAALGGLLLGFAESFLSTFYGASISSFVSFGVVIALLVLRPWGLLGKPE
ncbi:branched-chain amino acid ABC transporter permease [Bordetella sp. LUAb4]|uniref:branched-chain amino acid ABC transporter permease n=1 Tax=Bordetella sp. LUAb4 TaxID=2843195 RepID=UPI001E365FEE|nr:branched-chain amino acid ABC transporter permease [Bordetella sp. LUAb4]